MGCKTSKDDHVAELQVNHAHVRRRCSRPADLDLEPHPPPLKLVHDAGKSPAYTSRTPAVTPQAEAGPSSEPRGTSDATETCRPVQQQGDSSSDDQQIEQQNSGISVRSCAQQQQRESPGRRVLKEPSCEEIGEGIQDKSGRKRGETESEEPEGPRAGAVETTGVCC